MPREQRKKTSDEFNAQAWKLEEYARKTNRPHIAEFVSDQNNANQEMITQNVDEEVINEMDKKYGKGGWSYDTHEKEFTDKQNKLFATKKYSMGELDFGDRAGFEDYKKGGAYYVPPTNNTLKAANGSTHGTDNASTSAVMPHSKETNYSQWKQGEVRDNKLSYSATSAIDG